MASHPDHAVEIQRRYYTATSERYDNMHAHEGSGDPSLMKFVISFLRMMEVRTVLDVGAATGRSMRELKQVLPNVSIYGLEPVAALLQQAVQSGNSSSGALVQGSGDALPFADASFDAVCEFAVLHHVDRPNVVVKEMLRVARKIVILADSNRFGQGSFPARLFKLALYKFGLWSAFDYIRTGGKRYRITDGDGLAYSYSVFDSFDLVARWADRVILIPDPAEQEQGRSWFHPLLNSGGVLVCAVRDRAR